jgi:hypothetical protein
MIAFDLLCSHGHRFEGWFASSIAYEKQAGTKLLICPNCGDQDICKAVSAPFVGRKGNQAQALSSQANTENNATVPVSNNAGMPVELIEKLVHFQTELLSQSEYVGPKFVENARSIHYGETEDRLIHGEATAEQAQELHDEGIGIMPLPFPVIAEKAKN